MTATMTAADRDRIYLVDCLQNASLDLIGAASDTAAAVTALVQNTMADHPDACRAVLAAVGTLLDATRPVGDLVGQLDGVGGRR